MTFMSEFQQTKNFPGPRDDLPNVPFDAWGPHGFASIAPARPLKVFLGDLQSRVGWLPLAQFKPAPALGRDYEFDAHWALYVENFLEGLHIPHVHAGLMKTMEINDYSDELYRYANLQLAPAREGQTAFDLPASSPDHGQRIAAYYYWVFPNLMLNFYPWGLSLNLVVPLGPTRTKVLFRSFVWDEALLGSGAGGALDEVEMQDEAVVVTVQRGLRSRYYAGGRYSATRERGTHHFHRLLCEFMADPACSEAGSVDSGPR
jgi:choline monooxygenase